MAFGMSIMILAYAIGHVSGCHLNCAVTFSLMLSGNVSLIQVRLAHEPAQCASFGSVVEHSQPSTERLHAG